MTEKEIRRLNRHDLLVLLAEQTAHANLLEEKLEKKEKELKELHITLDELQKSKKMIHQVEEKSEEMKKIDEYWEKVYDCICKMEKEYMWLRGIRNEKNAEG